jgi:hypothetical protein
MSAAAGIYSRDLYNRLVSAFREAGGVSRHAARLAGVHEKTARKAFLLGWPRYEWARPIQEVIAEEREKSLSIVSERARRDAARAAGEAADARSQALEAGAQEAQILTAARKNVLAVFGLAARLVPAMDALVDVVRAATLDADGRKLPAAQIKVSADAALGYLTRHASILARAMVVGEQVVALGRAERGQASNIVGIAVADLTPAAAADLIEEQEVAIGLIREAAQRGKAIPRLPGGPITVESRAVRDADRAALAPFNSNALAEVEPAAVPRFAPNAPHETFQPSPLAETSASELDANDS